MDEERMMPVDRKRLQEFTAELQKYKSGKAHLERRVINAEQWWKLHNEYASEGISIIGNNGFHSKTGWLHNVIVSKHADAMEAYPEANILPREPNDKGEAKMLSAIVPVILEQNGFEQTYSDVSWQKLKTGTGCYHVYWDADKLNGLGDIAIERIDLLNIFWEPGITDLQRSKYIFTTELRDNDALEMEYPQLKDRLKGNAFMAARFVYDDSVSTDGKTTVIDCYYKVKRNGKTVLHYCKYVGDYILYSTENAEAGYGAEIDLTEFEHSMRSKDSGAKYSMDMGASAKATKNEDFAGNTEDPMVQQMPMQQSDPLMGYQLPTDAPMPESEGLYDHGLYPFVFDCLFPIEGSPCGYGYVDIGANLQTQIDLQQTAMVQNTVVAALPRYFSRRDGAINEEEFLDLRKQVVHVDGNLGDDSIKSIEYKGFSSNYVKQVQNTISMLRETTGNTEMATGSSGGGITAASAIAALQEASGKGSRDATKSAYRSFSKIISQVVELIRQFYDIPRKFRITGMVGQDQFVSYSNEGIKPQDQGMVLGQDLGYRLPVFDFKIVPQKANYYTKISQNELALQLYNSGFFVPQQATPALMCLEMMEFDGKDELIGKIQQNGSLMQMLQQAIMMLSAFDPMTAQQMGAQIGMPVQSPNAGPDGKVKLMDGDNVSEEPTLVKNARARANQASQPV